MKWTRRLLVASAATAALVLPIVVPMARADSPAIGGFQMIANADGQFSDGINAAPFASPRRRRGVAQGRRGCLWLGFVGIFLKRKIEQVAHLRQAR